MLLRWVILLILVWLAVEILMRRLRRLLDSTASPRAVPRGSQEAVGPRELVRCARCGVHFPRPPGRSDDEAFCSEECRRAFHR